MIRILSVLGVASVASTVDAARCRGRLPVYPGAGEACETRECRATFGSDWKSSKTCIRAPTCQELQDYSAYTAKLSGKCASADDTGASSCFQVRDGFPFALTVDDKRNKGDEVTCEGNARWFSFCVTQEASDAESLVISQIKSFWVKEGENTFAIAAAKAGCHGHNNAAANPFNPYGDKCGSTYAAFVLPDIVAKTGGSLSKETITVDDRERVYFVYRSAANLDPNSAGDGSLVVELHGLTSCAEYMALYTGWLQLAATQNMVIAWPQGTELAGLNFFTRRVTQNLPSWSAPLLPVPATAQGIDDVEFLRQMIVDIQDTLPVDEGRLYIAGHSNGASMAQHFAFENPHMVAAVASHSLFLTSVLALDFENLGQYNNIQPAPEPFNNIAPVVLSSPVPVFNVHGVADPLIQYNEVVCESGTSAPCIDSPGARNNNALWASLNQCQSLFTGPPATVEGEGFNVQTYGNCAGGVETKLLTVENAGHNPYYGAPIPGSTEIVEVPSTVMAWDFISQFTK